MYEYEARAKKIIDGDTIRALVDLGFGVFIEQTFRFAGIDTPEKSTKEGKAARKFVADRIMGKPIRIRSYKKGKYGRYIADIYYENFMGERKCLNEEVLFSGMGSKYKEKR